MADRGPHGLMSVLQYPTALAKIFGFFRISFNNTASGRRRRMDVMVMENLYHNKTISRQFDLKGSTRNRYVEVVEGKNQVLLDENLNESACPSRYALLRQLTRDDRSGVSHSVIRT